MEKREYEDDYEITIGNLRYFSADLPPLDLHGNVPRSTYKASYIVEFGLP